MLNVLTLIYTDFKKQKQHHMIVACHTESIDRRIVVIE